jgi:hypothetical protein
MKELTNLYTADLLRSDWRKSSYTASAGNCVEVASMPHSAGIAIRDSKDIHIPATRVSGAAWSTFLTAVTEGTIPGQ